MTARTLNVFTIPTHIPFLDALAEGLIARHFDPADPASLARATVLLPTRRAARSLGEHLLAHAKARGLANALVLPEIRPLGDVDEDALLLLSEETAFSLDGGESMPPLRRRLMLLHLVQGWAGARAKHISAAQAFHLATELERLIDRAETQGAALTTLKELVPAELAHHWAEIHEFLQIVAVAWPRIEAEADVIGPAKRRARLMERLCADWLAKAPDGPVIAAGSTGTIPATARLLKAVASLEYGAVILPGLDQALDERSWEQIGISHPQGAMKALLGTIGLARDEVQRWPYGTPSAEPARTRLLNEALRPWSATDGWRDVLSALERPALNFHRIEAAHQGEEAKAVALIMREALEHEGRTAALITPDRRLARAVQAELKRWEIDIDDSAGMPLGQTGQGLFLRLLAHAAESRLAPVTLLALLKHPLTTLGYPPDMLHRFVGGLDRALRGMRPAPGVTGLQERILECDKPHLAPFIDRLGEALKPLLALFEEPGSISFGAVLDAHLTAAEALAGPDRLWQGDAGDAIARLLEEMAAQADLQPVRPPSEYPDYVEGLLATSVIRPAYGRHPRLFIWGPLEARLQKADTLILGGLNEGVWPAEPGGDPWMSRGMMAAIALPMPEQRLGLSAHDFVQSAGSARQVYLTRALKSDGAPTVASRWLVRLETLLSGLGQTYTFDSAGPWLDCARLLDKPARFAGPVEAPAPKPPTIARPRRLSVTDIERWVRDPYAIYARHVLKLKALDPLDMPAGPALRGQIVHKIVEIFARPDFDPANETALAALLKTGTAVFDEHRIPAEIRALWWPRFEETARALLAEECKHRSAGERIFDVEIDGVLTLETAGGPFTVTGRADRIDRAADGSLIISDYKTGAPPTKEQMETGLAPQLPLEALMASEGGFEGLPAAGASVLRVIKAMGGAEPVTIRDVGDAEALAFRVQEDLRGLIARYDNPDFPYRSRPVPKFARDEGDFDHLARVKEWSAGGFGEEEP